MQTSKSLNKESCSGSHSRSALDDGMDRVCEKLDQEKAASIKLSMRHKLPKVVLRRLIPLKGEKPSAAPFSDHYPRIKKHARPLSKPLR